MANRIRDLFRDLALLRRYRAEKAARMPFRIRLPFIRDNLRHEAHEQWPGGYVFNDAGDLVHVPKPVDVMGGYRLLKPSGRHLVIGAVCRPNDVVVDVGANVGDWTLAAARVVGAGGRVLAFEPVPHIAESLRKTVRANRLQQVKVFELALAEAGGSREFSVERENTGGSRLDAMSNDPRRTFDSITVKTARLDEIAAAEKPQRLDLIKIDVEGFEHAVLSGAVETLKRFKPVLFMETGHETAERRAGTHALLSRLGYGIVGVMFGEGMVEATWDDYGQRKGVFQDLALADMLLMPVA